MLLSNQSMQFVKECIVNSEVPNPWALQRLEIYCVSLPVSIFPPPCPQSLTQFETSPADAKLDLHGFTIAEILSPKAIS